MTSGMSILTTISQKLNSRAAGTAAKIVLIRQMTITHQRVANLESRVRTSVHLVDEPDTVQHPRVFGRQLGLFTDSLPFIFSFPGAETVSVQQNKAAGYTHES
jgi:hypothetical protein